MKKVLLVAAIVMLCLPIENMLAGSDIINWDPVKQLTWKDYRKEEQKTGKHKTHSAIGIVIEPEQKDDQTMIANVSAEFNKLNSSKPDADAQTEDALHHEQLRFDLAEVHARMERKQLPDSTYKTIGKFYQIAQRINKQANKDFLEESAKYDDETKNGTDADAQKKWDKYVADQLGKYSDLTADQKVEIPIEKKITPEK
jgi:hypothetical protein